MSETPYITGSPEWHALRAKHVGGSEVACLFDAAPDYMPSRYALWHIKAGIAAAPEVTHERAAWGLRLEDAIASAAAEQERWSLRKGGYLEDPQCPGLGVSLDYVAGDPARGPGALEIKNVDGFVHRKSWVDDEPPLHILLQLQAQLACSGFAWGAVASLVGGNDLRVYRYEARPKVIAEIRRRVAAFWQSIQDGEPPPVDGSDSAAAVLRAVHAVARPEELDLSTDNAAPDICARLLDATARKKAAEADEKLAKNELAEKLCGHTLARIQGFQVRVAVTPEKEPTAAPEGYLIPGRKEVRRVTVKEIV